MPRFVLSLPSSFRAALLWSAVALSLLVGAAVTAKSLLFAPSVGGAFPITPAPPAVFTPVALSANQSRLQVERITIRPTGFDPAEVARPAGRFILAVDNRSGLRELTLRLADGDGRRLREVRVPREQLGWRLTLDAPAGSYVLTEVDHPDWVCRVTVTAQ
jgi:hypothetical protein